jgi:PHP family Zn ribbon phosphoesterase
MILHYDLHMHSALSPCGDADMTPGNIANMAALNGMELVALSDHNTCRNCPAFLAQAERAGLLALPAMELCTAEEVHILCLLPDLDAALAWDRYVYERLPDIPNRPEIFGEQVLYDSDDRPAGTEPRLLLSATSIGVYEARALLRRFGGLAVPAHVDRDSFSLLSNLGLYDPAMGFSVVEVTPWAPASLLPEIPKLINSDAHRLEDMPDALRTVEIPSRTAPAALDALRKL